MTESRPSSPPPAPSPRPVAPAPRPSGPPAAGGKSGGVGGPRPRKKSKAAIIGWIASAVILAAVIVGMIMALGLMPKAGRYPLGAPTELTTAKGALDKIEVNFQIDTIVSPVPTGGSGGAEQMYRELVKLSYPLTPMYNPTETPTLERVYDVANTVSQWHPKKGWNPKFEPIIDLLVKAADTPYNEAYDMLFPELQVSIQNEFAVAPYMSSLGRLAILKAMQEDFKKNYDEAEKLWRAALVYGDRLSRHGLYVGVRRAGFWVATEALDGLAEHYKAKGEDAKASAVRGVREATKPAIAKFSMKVDNLLLPRPKSAGDLWNLAENDKDLSWRVAGVMWLGYMKLEKGVNEPTVNAYLDKRATDKERIIAEKAAEARAFTLEKANQIRVQ